ncbi:MAG TPA: class I SAM-dependent methyltransferase [Pyrinomonadaceae bacterium]|nr:class I SAM-dependent methyltransferase [Pyrinomonadaceae bacterium]
MPVRTQMQKQELLEDATLGERERRLLRAVEARVFFNDGMYAGNGAHYFRVGLDALRLVEGALAASGLEEVRRVLDLPCGGGRVLRFLVSRFPRAEFVACDLQRDMADFCARQFGARAAYSKDDLGELHFDAPFDLVWCGSLATHLDASSLRALLKLFRRSLAPGGLAVFTTHGERVVRRMLADEFDYAIAKERIPAIVGSYRATGYGFTNYPDVSAYGVAPDAGYGVSLTSPEWVRAEAARAGGLREVFFEPHGWDEHQDVFGFVRQD